MSDPTHSARHSPLPPPAPPLPPTRPGAWQRLVGPLGFGQTSQSRPPSSQANRPPGDATRADPVRVQIYPPLPSQTAAHRTGIPIAALDCNGPKTHAVLAGHEILKTIHVANGKVTEEVNLRSAVNSSAHTPGRRYFQPASDVKWSHGSHSHIIATAAVNGPIALYNVTRATELASLSEQRNQVHKLAFNPHAGYLLLAGSQDGTTRLWDFRHPFSNGNAASSLQSGKQFAGRVGAVRDVRWSPTEGIEFVTGSDNGVIQKWDIRNPSAPVVRINGHQKPCISVDWHPDGRHVVSSGYDKYIRVWDFSTKQRQRPIFELKAPQAIKNVRWRPACWSAEMAGTGQWQSTQLVTSYNQDDPRLHVWDLRRPHLPFRELDRYNSPATDLLWASKDLLWTVGNEGMFTQTDVSFAPHPHNQIAPCAMHWTPDGEFISFAEDRSVRRGSGNEDPAVGFLSVPHEKLSSGEDGAISRSLTDDEASSDGLLSTSFRRRQSKAASARSTKSQSNTPPGTDDTQVVLPLDKAVFERKDLFNNRQVGVSGSVLGLSADPEVTEYLALAYQPASTDSERRGCPGKILQRLKEAFEVNADACDVVSMHRTAQTWRILGAVIVPELAEWAEKNRAERLQKPFDKQESPRQDVVENDGRQGREVTSSSPKPVGGTGKAQKVISNLFKGVFDTGRAGFGHELDSTSNMTTPLARPLPDSPSSDTAQSGPRFRGLEETMEAMPPLPPSVLTAHSAAAMASRALLETSSAKPETPSSPEYIKKVDEPFWQHGRSHTSDSVNLKYNPISAIKVLPQPMQIKSPDPPKQGQRHLEPQRQDDRRAALRDYRAQARPLLNFDDELESPQGGSLYEKLHDSSESFPMFSASTDSSHRERSLGGSFDSPEVQSRRPAPPNEWYNGRDSVEFEPSSPPSDESGKQNNLSRRYEPSRRGPSSPSDILRSTSFNFGVDGQSESIDDSSHGLWSANRRNFKDRDELPKLSMSAASSPDEPFHFEQPRTSKAPQVHSFNPLRLHPAREDDSNRPDIPSHTGPSLQILEDRNSLDFLYSDFCPIDVSHYEPELPFAWSSLPLICHSIAFDLSTGPASGQFSAHLLMHIYPYFFHQTVAHIASNENEMSTGVAERLMQPSSGRHIIESILIDYSDYLRRMELFVPLAEVRHICEDFDYPSVYGSSEVEQSKGDRLHSEDSHFLTTICSNCQTSMEEGGKVCGKCKHVEALCPICLALEYPRDSLEITIAQLDGNGHTALEETPDLSMWTLCHSCGHGTHFGCMVEWLSHPFSQGRCPSQGCGCDCGPGKARKERIDKQTFEHELRALQASNVISLKKDMKKAVPSPAVHKTRHLLREGERGTQSGDERGSTSRRSFGGNSQSQRKSVRVLTPGEVRAGE